MLLFLTRWWRPLLIAAIAVAGIATVWLYGKAQYAAGERDAKAAQHLAELEQFRAESERLQRLSADLVFATEALRTAKPKIIERYTHAATIQPLPADCVLDPGRLHSINEAIDAANAAAQPRAAMRAGGAAADE